MMDRPPPSPFLTLAMKFLPTTLAGAGAAALIMGYPSGIILVLLGLLPWIVRTLRLYTTWIVQMRTERRRRSARVDTLLLKMGLDQAGLRMDGEIRAGPHQGKRLTQLTQQQLLEFRLLAESDPESLRWLDAWLDRAWPHWRSAARRPRHAPPPPAVSQGMKIEEACSILGLPKDATAAEVKAAHRRLMRDHHPDHGGSTWAASRVNQARDVLLHKGVKGP